MERRNRIFKKLYQRIIQATIIMIKDFPKLETPFVRKEINGQYIVTPEINPDYNWVFNEVSFATDKIDGTNVCIRIENGKIANVFNRTTEKFLFNVKSQTRWEGAAMEGTAKAIQRGWLKDFKDGDYYGELIGEIFNGNRHQLQGHLFVPFNYLRGHCFWKSWTQNKYPKTFDIISEWFKELPSLFNQRLKLPDIKTEGLVIYNLDGTKMCKLRRDMWNWYVGTRHKEVN